MSSPIHAETPVRATIAKLIAGIITVSGAVWYVRGAVADYQAAMSYRMDIIDRRLTSIEQFIRHEAVTQSQAERYANAFKWENRALGISVPDPAHYQDKPRS